MKLLITLISLILLAQPGYAAISESAFASCAGKALDTERLACFDDLAERRGFTVGEPTALQEEAPGRWQEPNPDATAPALSLTAMEGVTHGEELPTLRIQCQDGDLSFSINWHTPLGGKHQVLTRIGEQDAQQLEWKREHNDRETTLQEQPRNFVRNMLASDRLLVQTVPFGEDPIHAIFDLRGMKAGMTPIEEECGM